MAGLASGKTVYFNSARGGAEAGVKGGDGGGAAVFVWLGAPGR